MWVSPYSRRFFSPWSCQRLLFHWIGDSWKKMVSSIIVFPLSCMCLINWVWEHQTISKNCTMKWNSWNLSENNRKQILIPPNFANGYLCLSDKCVYHYKYSYKGEYPDVKDQFTIKWNDQRLGIKWPIENPILYGRDK